MPAADAPIATVARLARTAAWRRFAIRADGPGWVPLGERLRDPAALDAWYRAELDGPAAGHPDLAGALIVYRFAGSLAELVMGPLLDQRRALRLTVDDIALQLHAGTRIDAVAATPAEVAVLPDDPVAGDAGTALVPDVAGLHGVVAATLHDVFAPLAEAVRARAPFGRAGMWGTLADHVAEGALSWAREHGAPGDPGGPGDLDAAWAASEGVLDHLAGREPRLRVRPRRHPVATPQGDRLYADKGTCCLVYKALPGVTDGTTVRGKIGAGACASCPLRSQDDRHARFIRHAAGG